VIVQVRLFARARDLAGQEALTLELPENASVADLRMGLAETWPTLRELLPRCAVAVDEEFAEDSTHLRETAKVALIPPVSGGER
jgi:molybdopterin converting factor subunit 1